MTLQKVSSLYGYNKIVSQCKLTFSVSNGCPVRHTAMPPMVPENEFCAVLLSRESGLAAIVRRIELLQQKVT